VTVEAGQEHRGAAQHARRRDDQRVLGADRGDDDRCEQRAGHEDDLEEDRVERVGGGDQRRVAGQEQRPACAEHGRHRREGGAGGERGAGQHRGAGARGAQDPDEHEAACVHERERQQRALAAPVHEPALEGSAECAAERERAGGHSRGRERAAHVLHVEQDREAADADGEAADQGREHDRRDARCPQDARVGGQGQSMASGRLAQFFTAMEPDAIEIRVVGCLIEKQRTTPDVYPLTLNALRLACNQSTNRDPVVDYDENTIRSAIERLVQRKWVTLASWSNRRSMKYRQTVDSALDLGGAEIAVLAVLMLRGPQTPGELKARTERLHPFADMSELGETVERLIGRDLVARLDRRPGQREERYQHRLSEGAEEPPAAAPAAPEEAAPADVAAAAPVDVAAVAPADTVAADDERIQRIERQLAELRSEIQALREELGA
jgi:uncharacterized protein YceH (UPF0502 family)